MSVEPTPKDRARLEQITSAWQAYDRTFDVSVVADYLAGDVMRMVPDRSPVVGKAAAVDYLDRPGEDADPDVEQWTENIYVSGDLAVVHAGVATVPDDAEEPVDEGIKGLDVYRRNGEREWEQIITISTIKYSTTPLVLFRYRTRDTGERDTLRIQHAIPISCG